LSLDSWTESKKDSEEDYQQGEIVLQCRISHE
jgi:hypothetical protein